MTTESNRREIGMTYREIASVMDISEGRVRQIYKKAMGKIHKHLLANPKLRFTIEAYKRD